MAEGNERSGKSYGGGHKGMAIADRATAAARVSTARQGRFQAAS